MKTPKFRILIVVVIAYLLTSPLLVYAVRRSAEQSYAEKLALQLPGRAEVGALTDFNQANIRLLKEQNELLREIARQISILTSHTSTNGINVVWNKGE